MSQDTLAEDLITNSYVLFESNGSPPLPDRPLGEPVPPVTYGSSHTKVGKMLPPPSPKRSPGLSRSPSLPPRPPPPFNSVRSPAPEDFTPQLPPHPPSSIHPSLRAGPMSAMPVRQSLPVQAKQVPPSLDTQVSVATTGPPSTRSASRESRRLQRTPRLQQRDITPDEPALSRREARYTPRTTPRSLPQPLVTEHLASTTTESSTFVDSYEDSDVQVDQIIVIPNNPEENGPTSASSGSTFASAKTSSSKESQAITGSATISPVASEGAPLTTTSTAISDPVGSGTPSVDHTLA